MFQTGNNYFSKNKCIFIFLFSDSEVTEVMVPLPNGDEASSVGRDMVTHSLPVPVIPMDAVTSGGEEFPGLDRVQVEEEVPAGLVLEVEEPSPDGDAVIVPALVSVIPVDAENSPSEVFRLSDPVGEEILMSLPGEVQEPLSDGTEVNLIERVEITRLLPVSVIPDQDAETVLGEVNPSPEEGEVEAQEPQLPYPGLLVSPSRRLPTRGSTRIRQPRSVLQVDPSKKSYISARPIA